MMIFGYPQRLCSFVSPESGNSRIENNEVKTLSIEKPKSPSEAILGLKKTKDTGIKQFSNLQKNPLFASQKDRAALVQQNLNDMPRIFGLKLYDLRKKTASDFQANRVRQLTEIQTRQRAVSQENPVLDTLKFFSPENLQQAFESLSPAEKADLLADIPPVLNTINSGVKAVRGSETFSGKELSVWERIIDGSIALTSAGALKVLGKLAVIATTMKVGANVLERADIPNRMGKLKESLEVLGNKLKAKKEAKVNEQLLTLNDETVRATAKVLNDTDSVLQRFVGLKGQIESHAHLQEALLAVKAQFMQFEKQFLELERTIQNGEIILSTQARRDFIANKEMYSTIKEFYDKLPN